MDALTHLFFPLVVAVAARPALFSTPRYAALAGGGLLADFDKLLGVPGLLHSLVTLVPICLGLIAAERYLRGESSTAVLASAFILSHLALDLLEGGPVPLLFPLVTPGVGLTYPMDVVFGTGLFGFTFRGWPVTVQVTALRTGYAATGVDTNSYGFIDGFGVASLLAFLTVVVSRVLQANTESATD